MLKTYFPNEAKNTILKRIALDDVPVSENILNNIESLFSERISPAEAVSRIVKDIKQNQDNALRSWTQKLDGVLVDDFLINQEEIDSAINNLSPEIRNAIELSANRVKAFHEAQPITSWMTQSLGGTLGQFVRPIQRVGIYIPAGTAPLPSSVIMSAVPAQVAGVKEIAIIAPPDRKTGKISPLILATAGLLSIHEIYTAGGAQAIAALAYGTESIKKVDKIFGPGNLFVSLAKRQLFGVVGIDSIAGPTETLVIADEKANPEWVAADLLAQAEHDALASAILLTPSEELIKKVQNAVTKQTQERNRSDIIRSSMNNRSGAVLTQTLVEAVELANQYAPEHLCLAVEKPWTLADKIYAAGGIFMGEHSFEVLGDYVAGPSHVMPTGGSARFSSPLNTLDFIHVVSLIALDKDTTQNIAPAAALIADAEGLDAHANAARMRI